MKHFITTLLLASLVLQAYAVPVTMKSARAKANDFLAKETSRPARLQDHPVKTLMDADGHPLCYIFNTADGDGFVIATAGDDSDIIAYSTTSAFDEAQLSPAMTAWMKTWQGQLKSSRHNTAKKVKPRFSPEDNIAPLLDTQWDQGNFMGNAFNKLAPIVNDSVCVSGCVATAMAQVMKYHQWPTDSCPGIPGYDSGRAGVLDSLPPCLFEWEKIVNIYDGSESEEEAMALANLMQYCGHAVKTQYAPKISEAYGRDAVKAFVEVFGYKNAKYVKNANYDENSWNRLIYNELSCSRPVVYFGFSTQGGHCFVCDGYDGNGFYHINWGWGGKGDGYFKFSLLNPDEDEHPGESGYTLNQCAIIGIAKNATSEDVIQFNDSVAKKICVDNWDSNKDGQLSQAEAQTVLSLSDIFQDIDTLVSFNELRYFTGLRSISQEAFKGCKALESITLPEGIVEIGDHAFEGCAQLEEIIVPKSVDVIGKGILDGCNSLTSLMVDEDNETYDSRDNCNAVILTADNKLVLGCATTVIPATVTSIGDQAFRNNMGVTQMDIPQGVTEIGNGAFEGCARLFEVELPASVLFVGNRAFANCKTLCQLRLPVDLTIIGNSAFAGCTSLTSIWSANPQPPQCGNNAFIHCRSMVFVPDGSKELYMEAEGWRDLIIVEEESEDALYCNDIAFAKSSKGTLRFGLHNTCSVIGLQFNLKLPEGFSVKQTEGVYNIDLTERTSNHEVYCNMNSDGSYRILLLSLNIDEIFGNDGYILGVEIEAADSIDAGDYTCELSEIVLSTIDGMEISGTHLAPFSSNIKLREFELGDVNCDKQINIADVMQTVCHIINLPAEAFHEEYADLNEDFNIDIIDVMRIIQLIVNQPIDEDINGGGEDDEIDEIPFANEMILTPTSANTFAMEVDHPETYTAMEMTVRLSGNGELASVAANDAHHRTMLARRADGSYRVVVYSGDGASFGNRSNHFAILTTKGNANQVHVSDVVFTNSRFETIPFATATGTTLIETIDAIATDAPAYNLSGQRVDGNYKGIVVKGGTKQVRR